jgi:UDP-2-acetamido-3-amino-2,3-dideoxy-glucuronate N-acetyltransferase
MKRVDSTAFIHPLSHVDTNTVTIGARTKIWQFASIIQGTVIGNDCNVGACVVLSGPVIGNGTKVSSGVVIGPGFKVGNNVFIGPNVVLANDMWPFANTKGYDEETLREGVKFSVIVGDGAFIGANAVVLPGRKIGKRAGVASGAVVERDIPDDMVLRRNGYLSPIPENWHQHRMQWAS